MTNRESDYTLFSPHFTKRMSWEINGGDQWKRHILDAMIENEVAEVREIVEKFIEAIDDQYVAYLSELQLYPEHYLTHSRDVTKFAFELMNLDPDRFEEKDVLIVVLASLFHDLGQFNPECSSSGKDSRSDELCLEDVFFSIINSFKGHSKGSSEKYFSIFSSKRVTKKEDLTTFGKLLFNVALYHSKKYAFNEEYSKIYKRIFGKNKPTEKDTLCKVLENILGRKKGTKCDEPLCDSSGKESTIGTYLGIAAIIQFADAIDVWKYRNTSINSFVMRMNGLLKKMEDAFSKETEEKSLETAYESLESFGHVLKDSLINNIKLSLTGEILNLDLTFSKTDAIIILSRISEFVKKNDNLGRNNAATAAYFMNSIEKISSSISSGSDLNGLKTDLTDLRNWVRKGGGSKPNKALPARIKKETEENFFINLIVYLIVNPILIEFCLTHDALSYIINNGSKIKKLNVTVSSCPEYIKKGIAEISNHSLRSPKNRLILKRTTVNCCRINSNSN